MAQEARNTRIRTWLESLFDPVDAASLVFFRVAFGTIMAIECLRYLKLGWITREYVEPTFYFKYFGFGWVEPWAGDGMYWHFVVLAVLSACVATGFLYRAATILFFFGFSYVFLLEQARYLNHFYFVIILSLLLALVPAHRAFSIDALLRPKLRRDTVPGWTVFTLRAQMEIVLIFAGLVKISADWLRLEPLSMWMARRGDDARWIGPLMNEDWVVAIGAYGSIAIHLVGAPLLLFRRTRLAALVAYTGFHLSNHLMFEIGIFPWLTIAATLIFLDPDWPKALARSARRLFVGPSNTGAVVDG